MRISDWSSDVCSSVLLDPLQLFMQADIVVQAVMTGLILASIWVWMIVVSFSLRMGRLESAGRQFEADFWQAEEFDSLPGGRGRKAIPASRVAQAGLEEWKRSTGRRPVDRDGARQRIAGAMESRVALEADELAERLNFLATTGPPAPLVRLSRTARAPRNTLPHTPPPQTPPPAPPP